MDKFGWIPRRTIKRAYTSLNTKFDDADIVKFGVVGLLPQPRGNWNGAEGQLVSRTITIYNRAANKKREFLSIR